MSKTKNLTKQGAGIRVMAYAASLLFALLLQVQLLAQQKTVTGKVVNATSGEPIVGASIVVKGTTLGGTTDEKGFFSMSVPASATTLVVSYTGFLEMEVPASENIRQIKLTSQGDMGEVVVVGYGKQKKTTLTGAVETISSKTFESRAITNVALALQGASPALVVTRTSPRPGNENLNLRIRGNTSVNGNNPLVVIDGVPTLNDYSFLNMNSDDIESISVLKDASASIYGSRASNGVILVTTKRGKGGKLKVDYTGNMRYNTNGITGYSPNMQQYATMWLEANKEETKPNYWVWGQDNLLKMQQGIEGAYPLYGTDFFIFNANRLDEMFARQYSYQHNLSLASSNDRSAYRLSFGYADNRGNLATAYDGQKQYNARFNYDYKLSDKLKMESSISFIDAKTSTPSVGLDNTLYGNDMPFYPAKNPFGHWFATFNGIDGGATRNAAAMTSDGGRDNKNSLTARIDLKATYQILPELALEGMASLQNERFNQEKYVLQVPLYNWYDKQTGIGTGTAGNANNYYTYAWTGYYQYYSALLRYNKTFKGVHNVSATAGINAEKRNEQWLSATRIGFENLGVQDISLASATNQTNNGFKTQLGRYSYLARFNYNYKEKYILELLGRRDGNSRFATGYKFKNFGSASAGWVFTNEDFLKDITSILNFGKVRASYGVSGNEATNLKDFEYLTTISTGYGIMGQTPAQVAASSLSRNGLISNTRTWERVRQKNLGIDASFLKSRLTASYDYFVKDNIGMLVDVKYPSVLGGDAPKTNNGRFNTKGWELVVSWKDTKKDFSYNVSFNISNTKSLVTNVQNRDSYGAGKNDIVNGFPWQPYFLYKTDGYFKDQADVDAYYAAYGNSPDLVTVKAGDPSTTLRPGDTKKVDVAGKGVITGIYGDNTSLVYKGDGTPHFTFGLNMGASYKGFDITAFFQGQFKQLIMRQGPMAYPFYALYTNQNPAFLGKTWTEDNPNAIFPRLTAYQARAKWNYVNNDFMLQNNRYIRLKSLILGYSLPKKITSLAKLNRVRVYFSGNDLWELAKVRDGFDPEMGEASVDFSTSDGRSPGGGYPFSRTWSFGLNIGL
jgi:TonB-linked SusC/RagA family outer membrane protein